MWFKNYKIAQRFGELGMIDKNCFGKLKTEQKMKKIINDFSYCLDLLMKIFIVRKALKLTSKSSFPLDEIKLCEPKFMKKKLIQM